MDGNLFKSLLSFSCAFAAILTAEPAESARTCVSAACLATLAIFASNAGLSVFKPPRLLRLCDLLLLLLFDLFIPGIL